MLLPPVKEPGESEYRSKREALRNIRKLCWALFSFWTGFICLIEFDVGLWLIGLGLLLFLHQFLRRRIGFVFEEAGAFVTACIIGMGVLCKFGPEPIPLMITFVGTGLAISLDLLHLRARRMEA